MEYSEPEHTRAEQLVIAKRFVEAHKHSDLADWGPMYEDGDGKLITIYYNLIGGEYGYIDHNGGNDYEVEISKRESHSGYTFLFDF